MLSSCLQFELAVIYHPPNISSSMLTARDTSEEQKCLGSARMSGPPQSLKSVEDCRSFLAFFGLKASLCGLKIHGSGFRAWGAE